MTIESVRNEYLRQFMASDFLEKQFAVMQASEGVLSAEAVKEYAQGSMPALFVGVLGVEGIRDSNGSKQGKVKLVAYVLCQSSEESSAGNIALGLVQSVVLHYKNVSHADFIGTGDIEDASNLFGGTNRENDFALWGIRITQKVWLYVNSITTICNIETETRGNI